MTRTRTSVINVNFSHEELVKYLQMDGKRGKNRSTTLAKMVIYDSKSRGFFCFFYFF